MSMLTYKQKHDQANREALATVGALAITIVVWIACGFGLSALDLEVFHTPLWVIGGTVGTWACAIAVSVVLSRRFFADFDLEDVEPEAAEDAAGAARAAGTAGERGERGGRGGREARDE